MWGLLHAQMEGGKEVGEERFFIVYLSVTTCETEPSYGMVFQQKLVLISSCGTSTLLEWWRGMQDKQTNIHTTHH